MNFNVAEGISMSSKKRALCFEDLKREKGIPWTRQHVRRLECRGEFPHHIDLGPGTIAWLENEIDAWLEERARERRAA